MQRLVGPALLELQQARGALLGGPSLVVGRTVAGTQLGLMLAYMATRVLGQYDLLINDETPEDQDLVSYVGPEHRGRRSSSTSSPPTSSGSGWPCTR